MIILQTGIKSLMILTEMTAVIQWNKITELELKKSNTASPLEWGSTEVQAGNVISLDLVRTTNGKA